MLCTDYHWQYWARRREFYAFAELLPPPEAG